MCSRRAIGHVHSPQRTIPATPTVYPLDDATTNGIGPYDGSVLRTATVHVFSQVGTGERDVANLCAVTAHEVGHSLGLDHSFTCGDLMSYFNDACGTQRFLDVDGPCGEDVSRDCAHGDATQNSYQRLAQNVGLRGAPQVEEPRTAPIDADDDSTDAGDDYDADDNALPQATFDADAGADADTAADSASDADTVTAADADADADSGTDDARAPQRVRVQMGSDPILCPEIGRRARARYIRSTR